MARLRYLGSDTAELARSGTELASSDYTLQNETYYVMELNLTDTESTWDVMCFFWLSFVQNVRLAVIFISMCPTA